MIKECNISDVKDLTAGPFEVIKFYRERRTRPGYLLSKTLTICFQSSLSNQCCTESFKIILAQPVVTD